jgi:serine/threonine-protein kinase RIM15
VRRPIPRIVELVVDLCDTAMEITMPAVKEGAGVPEGEIRTQSPESEGRISQVLQWQSPSSATMEQEQGLSALCEDTTKLSRAKIDAVMRYRGVLEYSERIRIEFENLVSECITAAVEKAARIAAGEISDSSDESIEDPEPERLSRAPTMSDEGVFPCSLEAPSAMAMALRNASDPSVARPVDPTATGSSTATSTRSSSPRGSRTPRSTVGSIGLSSLSKRASIQLESDAGADSDSSVLSSALSGPRRAESPVSELSLSRVASSRERKRRSLILPSVMTRQQSPARSMPPPSSPLRMAKNRIPSGTESSQSPVTSPVLSTSEFSSPAISAHHLQHLHRRQSSAASSEVFRPPSPKLASVSSNPQPRAAPPSIRDFEIIKPISKGAFGSVYLAKKKSTAEYFAIKVLKKADMVAKNQVTNVKAERAIMMWQGESDFVAKLYWTFASKEYLYLVMEYMNGGDCASLIKALGGLPEDWSKRYLAEVVLGVEHLHSRGIVHRDLKPDNLLIDQKGHLKLTDFGLSRMGIVGRQKRVLSSKSDESPVPDLLKQGPFQRAVSVGSSRSASFDLHGNSYSPSQTPSMTPAVPDMAQPSYFNLNKESNHRSSGGKSDSENSEALQAMLRKFSLVDPDASLTTSQSPIEEETSSAGDDSPDPYALHPVSSSFSAIHSTTPPASTMLPPTLALFDPEDSTRKFVGTPDYLAPETINGVGQDELSDWWSLGCILFEFLYGYPPFHADTPDQVFQNILARKIDWPPEELDEVSPEAKDLMNRLMCIDPTQRLGANVDENFSSGGEEIRNHDWFSDIDWEMLRETEASFVPAPENPEDTEYFDARGATLQSFAPEFEDQVTSPVGTPGANEYDRPHDALSRVRSQVNSIKRGLMPLHIPPHVRDGSRSRRLSEPIPADDFGNFTFKNLPVLEKANKDVIQKLRAEAMQAQSKPMAGMSSPVIASPTPSLESSPAIAMPMNKALSSTKGTNRPSSPLLNTQPTASPSRISQPSSPLLVQFSTGQGHERRKTSSSSSSLSQQTSGTLQPGSFFDAPRIPALKPSVSAPSPIKLAKSPGAPIFSSERQSSAHRQLVQQNAASPRGRSHTVSSQESEDIVKDLKTQHTKRRSQILDNNISPSSSDNEDTRQKALLRVQRRRQSSRRLSQITLSEGPMFRPLDVLVCEDHPVSRLVMEKLLEKLRCRSASARTGPEALKFATSEVKFDIILMEFKLPQVNGTDVARMIRKTKNANSTTPIVAVTGYLKELPPNHYFDGLVEKPPTIHKLTEIMGRLCQWKPLPPDSGPTQYPLASSFSHLRLGSGRSEDSPTSNSSGFGAVIPSGSYRGSSREDSISSSFFGDVDSRADDVPVAISKQSAEDWQEGELNRAFEGLGISEDAGPASSELKSPDQLQPYPGTLDQNTARPLKSGPGEFVTPKKKRSSEGKSRGSAESGDDEDEELGHTHIRARSPKTRARGSSKLGTEMMRTNSQGSVVSVEEVGHSELPSSPPPAIAEDPSFEEAAQEADEKEKESKTAAAAAELARDVDVTPKPAHHTSSEVDPDPTPRPSSSRPSSRADAASESPNATRVSQ